MALAALSGDAQCIIFSQLCNVLDMRVAVAFSSTSSELRALTQALRQQLRADHEVAATLGRKVGMRSCKALREAMSVSCSHKGLSAADLATLGTLGSVLPALEVLHLIDEPAAGPDGLQRLAEGLGAGALPALTLLGFGEMHVGDAGASALAAALGGGALPRLKHLTLANAAIGDAGLVALAPALRRRPALEILSLNGNPLGDEGLAALLAPPPPPAGALSPPTGVLTKLKGLDLRDTPRSPTPAAPPSSLKRLYLPYTQITDAGCAALASALDGGALPALELLIIHGIPASEAATAPLMARFHPDS